jgi:hypothetical protein
MWSTGKVVTSTIGRRYRTSRYGGEADKSCASSQSVTPCNSRKLQLLGTSTRRHIIGLISRSQRTGRGFAARSSG